VLNPKEKDRAGARVAIVCMKKQSGSLPQREGKLTCSVTGKEFNATDSGWTVICKTNPVLIAGMKIELFLSLII
jgi:hypothetical protein